MNILLRSLAAGIVVSVGTLENLECSCIYTSQLRIRYRQVNG